MTACTSETSHKSSVDTYDQEGFSQHFLRFDALLCWLPGLGATLSTIVNRQMKRLRRVPRPPNFPFGGISIRTLQLQSIYQEANFDQITCSKEAIKITKLIRASRRGRFVYHGYIEKGDEIWSTSTHCCSHHSYPHRHHD